MRALGWASAIIIILALVVGVCGAVVLIDWYRTDRKLEQRRKKLERLNIVAFRGTKANSWWEA